MTNTQKLSIRLLRKGCTPVDAVRKGVDLKPWGKLKDSMIALETLGGGAPKWAHFLELSEDEKNKVTNFTAFCVVFVKASDRWFAISFGMGHVKLDLAAFEQNFGLRVVLNSVNPKQLKSTDYRTPDENTLSRRAQASRGSDQTAFAFNNERDIVRGLAGIPKDSNFGSHVAGTDGLTLNRKININELPHVCSETLKIYGKLDYKTEFGWIDQIRHIRDKTLIRNLNNKLIKAIISAINDGESEDIHLAFPIIYDPEKWSRIRYKGFRSQQDYDDLDLRGYLNALKERRITNYKEENLHKHTAHEVDDNGHDCGGKWKLYDCIVFETDYDESTYVLSVGCWYKIDQNLAKAVQDYFNNTSKVDLPKAMEKENEEQYNKRISESDAEMICLDRQFIRPIGANSSIEVCDFLGLEHQLIHIKNKTSSSRLSHLFNQGTVSARILVIDPESREKLIEKIVKLQKNTGKTGYKNIIPKAKEHFDSSIFTVVYGVIVASDNPRLPFFSLISFRQAAQELKALGYKCAFAWIIKPKASSKAEGKWSTKTTVNDAALQNDH